MEKTKKFPDWLNSADVIEERVQKDGYDFILLNEEIDLMLSIEPLSENKMMTAEEHQKHALNRMSQIEKLKDELIKRDILLYNIKGLGYKVLHPDDQITIGWKKEYKKSIKHLKKGMEVLINVKFDLLTKQKEYDHNVALNTFLLNQANKKTLKNKALHMIE